MTEETNTGYGNTGSCNTGSRNSGSWNTGNWNTGYGNTGYGNTGSWNTGYGNTGSWNTGYGNTGDWNTGSRNSGYFNTDTPTTVRAFGKDCERSEWDAADKPSWLYEPSPTTWVHGADMTGAEKADNPTFTACGGYLRVNDWHEEWRKAYTTARAEDVQKVRDLPNFDAAIFEEITGIDLSQPKQTAPREIVIEGSRYILAEDGQ